jgi:hypothetical protein
MSSLVYLSFAILVIKINFYLKVIHSSNLDATTKTYLQGLDRTALISVCLCNCQNTLICTVDANCGRGRALTIALPHGEVHTPVYMPVGTKAAMKGITQLQMENLAAKYSSQTLTISLLLQELITSIRWAASTVLQDGKGTSSLIREGIKWSPFGELSRVDEKGVHFSSPYGGETIFLRPEDSISCRIVSELTLSWPWTMSSRPHNLTTLGWLRHPNGLRGG